MSGLVELRVPKLAGNGRLSKVEILHNRMPHRTGYFVGRRGKHGGLSKRETPQKDTQPPHW
jgi:hypothetical protein